MQKWLNKLEHLNPRDVFWSVVAVAILLAAWMQYIQHGWINPDSVLYLEQAKRVAIGEWRGAYDIFNWPLYGACIGLVHAATGLGVHVSAQLLNMVFFGLAMAAFLSIIRLCGGSSKTMLAGALLVFSSQYIVGDVLEMLMRDEGFWAFYLWAVFFFLRFYLRQNLADAIYWQIAIAIATLFRIEAILYAFFLPLIWLARSELSYKHRLLLLLQSYSLGLLAAVAIAAALALSPNLSMQDFGRLREIFTPRLYHEFTQNLFARSEIMSEQVLGSYLEEFATTGLLLTFIWVMVSKTLTATGLIGTALSVLGIKKRQAFIPKHAQWVLLALIFIALFSMYLIIVKVFVLSSRYAVALAWILLIFAAFYLAEIFQRTSKKQRALLLLASIILLLGCVKNVLPKRTGYNHMQAAVSWLVTHKHANTSVFYDESRLRYYGNAPFIGTITPQDYVKSSIADNSIRTFDYLVISEDVDHLEIAQLILKSLPEYCEIQRFNGFRAKKATVIYAKDCPHATSP